MRGHGRRLEIDEEGARRCRTDAAPYIAQLRKFKNDRIAVREDGIWKEEHRVARDGGCVIDGDPSVGDVKLVARKGTEVRVVVEDLYPLVVARRYPAAGRWNQHLDMGFAEAQIKAVVASDIIRTDIDADLEIHIGQFAELRCAILELIAARDILYRRGEAADHRRVGRVVDIAPNPAGGFGQRAIAGIERAVGAVARKRIPLHLRIGGANGEERDRFILAISHYLVKG